MYRRPPVRFRGSVEEGNRSGGQFFSFGSGVLEEFHHIRTRLFRQTSWTKLSYRIICKHEKVSFSRAKNLSAAVV